MSVTWIPLHTNICTQAQQVDTFSVMSSHTVFCLDGQGKLMHVDEHQCAVWLAAMFTTTAPESAKWYQVPTDILPQNASVAYFSAEGWMAVHFSANDQDIEEDEGRHEFVPFSGKGNNLK